MIPILAVLIATARAPVVGVIAKAVATTTATTAARLLTQKGLNKIGTRSPGNRSGNDDPEEREARLALLRSQTQAAKAEKLASEQSAATDRARRLRDLVWTAVAIIVGLAVLGALAFWVFGR